MNLVPMVIEKDGRGERAYDILFKAAQGAYSFPRHGGG